MSTDQSTHTMQALARQTAEAERDRSERTTFWAFIWILFGFKMATVLAICWASGSMEVAALIGATTWAWIVIPGFAIAGPATVHWRMRKARKRRKQLQEAEWKL